MNNPEIFPPRRHVSPTTIIILISLLIFSSVSLSSRILKLKANNNDWDVIIFTQNWPPSVCLMWQEKTPNGTCSFPTDRTEWTIHGAWPTKLGTTGPGFCNLSLPFNEEEIYGLEDELNQRWTGIENHKKKHMLWRHEWLKHGTCAASLPALSTEFKYFYQALEWSKQYDIKTILSKVNISASDNSFSNATTIWNSIRQVIGKDPYLFCYVEPKTKMSYLLEVRICFDKSLQLTDCDGVKARRYHPHRVGDKSSKDLIQCPFDRLVHYPLTTPKPPPPAFMAPDPVLITAIKIINLLHWFTL